MSEDARIWQKELPSLVYGFVQTLKHLEEHIFNGNMDIFQEVNANLTVLHPSLIQSLTYCNICDKALFYPSNWSNKVAVCKCRSSKENSQLAEEVLDDYNNNRINDDGYYLVDKIQREAINVLEERLGYEDSEIRRGVIKAMKNHIHKICNTLRLEIVKRLYGSGLYNAFILKEKEPDIKAFIESG